MKLWSELGGEPGIPADGSEKSEETHSPHSGVCGFVFLFLLCHRSRDTGLHSHNIILGHTTTKPRHPLYYLSRLRLHRSVTRTQ